MIFFDGQIAVLRTEDVLDEQIALEIEQVFLTVVHVHANEAAGDTLPELITTVRSELTTRDRHALDSGLQEVGYLDVHAQRYRGTRYQIREIRHFKVGPGFPRLTSQDLPAGVKGVRYEIGIDACSQFKVDSDDVRRELRTQDAEG